MRFIRVDLAIQRCRIPVHLNIRPLSRQLTVVIVHRDDGVILLIDQSNTAVDICYTRLMLNIACMGAINFKDDDPNKMYREVNVNVNVKNDALINHFAKN